MSITPIPEGGWTMDDIGREVTLLLPCGTLLIDTIITLPLNGQMLIGSTHEIGGILARDGYARGAMQAYEAWQASMDDDDNEGLSA